MNETQEKFEAWYKQQYWNFPDDIRKITESGYRHLEVQLAYRAFCAGVAAGEIERIKIRLDNAESTIKLLSDILTIDK